MGRTRSDYPLKDYYRDIVGTYDRVNRIFTFGRDKSWRKAAAKCCLETQPRSVLDICTGTGDFIFELARQAKEDVTLTGYDFSDEMLDAARLKHRGLLENESLASVDFVRGDVAAMPFKAEQYDAAGITFGMRNLIYRNSNAAKHLSEIRRVLRKGGHLTLLESSRPDNALWRFLNTLYLRLVLPYIGGLISGNFGAYRYLAMSSRNYYSVGEMTDILSRAGFGVTYSRPLFLGSVMLVVAEKTGEDQN